MAVFELYSKRIAKERGQTQDVYEYDAIPNKLRTQIIHIWGDAIGIPHVTHGPSGTAQIIESAYHSITSVLRREYGTFSLTRNSNPNNKSQSMGELKQWFLSETNTERVLDAIELSANMIENFCSTNNHILRPNARKICLDAISELNERFLENAVGYQYSDKKIIRIDSQFVHSEAVIPAISVLSGQQYANAQEEFLSAFEHYRHGSFQEALVDCAKCFESTMKVICTKRGWQFDPNRATASELVRICLENGLIPPYWENHFTGLRTMLTSGIPTARNRQGGHGAGTTNNDPPGELVSYVLHMTASTVLFLAKSEEAMS